MAGRDRRRDLLNSSLLGTTARTTPADGLRKVWTRSVGLARFAYQIREFLSEPLTAEQAAAIVAKGVRRRDARFLGKLGSAVYGNPRSPYRKLLESAGCEPADVESLVRHEGLEGALEVLARAGVYLTFDEFKCRVPVVRGSRKFEVDPADLDDPDHARRVRWNNRRD